MTKVAIYARCSTTEQFVDNQLEALRQYATERGLEVVAEYSENKSGWKDGHQLELINLVTDAKRRKFNAVLVWSLDRLSRGGPGRVLTLVNTLNAYGVGVARARASGKVLGRPQGSTDRRKRSRRGYFKRYAG